MLISVLISAFACSFRYRFRLCLVLILHLHVDFGHAREMSLLAPKRLVHPVHLDRQLARLVTELLLLRPIHPRFRPTSHGLVSQIWRDQKSFPQEIGANPSTFVMKTQHTLIASLPVWSLNFSCCDRDTQALGLPHKLN